MKDGAILGYLSTKIKRLNEVRSYRMDTVSGSRATSCRLSERWKCEMVIALSSDSE
jgi:hypothetical protein